MKSHPLSERVRERIWERLGLHLFHLLTDWRIPFFGFSYFLTHVSLKFQSLVIGEGEPLTSKQINRERDIRESLFSHTPPAQSTDTQGWWMIDGPFVRFSEPFDAFGLGVCFLRFAVAEERQRELKLKLQRQRPKNREKSQKASFWPNT